MVRIVEPSTNQFCRYVDVRHALLVCKLFLLRRQHSQLIDHNLAPGWRCAHCCGLTLKVTGADEVPNAAPALTGVRVDRRVRAQGFHPRNPPPMPPALQRPTTDDVHRYRCPARRRAPLRIERPGQDATNRQGVPNRRYRLRSSGHNGERTASSQVSRYIEGTERPATGLHSNVQGNRRVPSLPKDRRRTRVRLTAMLGHKSFVFSTAVCTDEEPQLTGRVLRQIDPSIPSRVWIVDKRVDKTRRR